MKTEIVVGFFLIFIWCENQMQKIIMVFQKKRRSNFDSLVLRKKCISYAPSTPDLKKKPYVPNLGYFSDYTTWSN